MAFARSTISTGSTVMVIHLFRTICTIPFAAGCLLTLVCGAELRAQTLTAQSVATGFSSPSFAMAPPGDVERLFVTELKTAQVKLVDLTTQSVLPTPFLDLPDIVGSAKGLQAIAFHPDYANNGRFYLNLSDGAFVRIVEYTVSADPNVADPASARAILNIPHVGNHDGGWLGFSPVDGYLYVATGEEGIPEQGQDLNTLKGKVLRLDVDGDDFPADTERNYAIPPTNPFIGAALPEIWSFGLRHPFRSSFDPETGDLYIADVGSTLWEEINFQPGTSGGGENYGWRPKEGSLPNPAYSDPIPPDVVDPIHEYPHVGGAAVIGGFTYRGESIPSLDGTYFFAEFIEQSIQSFRFEDGAVVDLADRTNELFALGSDGFGQISSFGIDGRGELYLVDRTEGAIYRIAAASRASLSTPTDVWIGSGSGVWSSDANWEDGGAPPSGGGSDQILEFNYLGPDPAPSFTNDLGSPFVANGLIINTPGAGGAILDGNPVELVDNVASGPFIEVLGTSAVQINMDLVVTNDATMGGAGADLSLGGVISGPGGVVVDRNGASTTIVGETTFTGATVVRNSLLSVPGSIAASSSLTVEDGGQINLDYSAADDKLGDAATVTLGFGALHATSTDAADVTEVVGQLALMPNTANTITVVGDSAAMILNASSFQGASGGVALVRGPNLGQAGGSQISFDTAPTLVGGSGAAGATNRGIMSLVVADPTPTGAGSSFATYDAVNGVTPLDLNTEYAVSVVSGSSSDDNVRATGAIAALDDATTINSLLIDTGGSVAGAGTLTVSSGSILSNGANGGIGVANLDLPSSESLVWANADITISGALNAAGNFTKAGAGDLEFTGATAVVGTTSIVEGSLVANGTSYTTDALKIVGPTSQFEPASGTTTIGDLSIGNAGSLALISGTLATVTNSTVLESDGVLRIDGGTLQTGNLAITDGRLFFVAGTLDLTDSDLTVDSDGLLGRTVTLEASKTLSVSGTTTVNSAGSLAMTGGTLISDQLVLDGAGASFSAKSSTQDVDQLLISNGAVLTVGEGEGVTINEDVVIDAASSLSVDGGVLSTGRILNNGGAFSFAAGNLQLLGSDLNIGAQGLLGATVTLDSSRVLDISGTTTVAAGGALNVQGGSFTTGSLIIDTADATLTLSGPSPAMNDFTLRNGAQQFISLGQSLAVGGTTQIGAGSVLHLTGGTLTTGDIIVDGGLNFASGVLELTSQDFVVGPGGLLGAVVTLADGQHVSTSQNASVDAASMLQLLGGSSLTADGLTIDGVVQLEAATATVDAVSIQNDGVIQGYGRVLADLSNTAQGEVRTQSGESLLFLGAGHNNLGTIESIGGELEFQGLLTNDSPSGVINARDATLRFSGGLTNNGDVHLSFGTSDLFGDIVNSGIVIASGDSKITYYDDVDNQGEIRNTSGSQSVFFGDVSGPGVFTGGGTTAFEGSLQPGNGAAQLAISGDVRFGPLSNLEIEISSDSAGGNFDRLEIDGTAVLDGVLSVELIDLGGGAYQPTDNDSYTVLTAAAGLSGQFAFDLPALPDDLTWVVSYTANSLVLDVDIILSADFDVNGVVDSDDLIVWESNLGTLLTATQTEGDATGDGNVLGRDILYWQRQHGDSILVADSVPEPSALQMMFFLTALGAGRRRCYR